MKFNTVLLVDDDPAHTTLIERNLRRAGYLQEVIKLEDGQKAIDWLEQHNSASEVAPFVLLDINMPVKNGMEVLARIKDDDSTKHIPVVMLTTTDNPSEVKQCYQLGCNAYITKSVVHDKFKETIEKLGLFIDAVCAPQLQY